MRAPGPKADLAHATCSATPPRLKVQAVQVETGAVRLAAGAGTETTRLRGSRSSLLWNTAPGCAARPGRSRFAAPSKEPFDIQAEPRQASAGEPKDGSVMAFSSGSFVPLLGQLQRTAGDPVVGSGPRGQVAA